MALDKFARSGSGKVTEVASTDSVQQVNEARIYTPDGTSPPADGDFVYMDAQGELQSAKADADATSEVIGFYENTDDSVVAKRGSEVTGFNVETAITMAAGDTAYLSSAEAGKVTNVEPSTTGHHVIELGYMESATKLILAVKHMYVA